MLPDGRTVGPSVSDARNTSEAPEPNHQQLRVRWDGWADLRFVRIDVGADGRLSRRVPPAEAWAVLADDRELEIFDAVGRGDRSFSNGEVRLVPAPPEGVRLRVAVQVAPGTEPLTADLYV